jgi:putative transposase
MVSEIDTRRKDIICQVCAHRNAPVVELETMPDNTHILGGSTRGKASTAPGKAIKGRSSRHLRPDFAGLRSRLPARWTHTHFVVTAGGSTLEVAKRHVQNQPNI